MGGQTVEAPEIAAAPQEVESAGGPARRGKAGVPQNDDEVEPRSIGRRALVDVELPVEPGMVLRDQRRLQEVRLQLRGDPSRQEAAGLVQDGAALGGPSRRGGEV